jgi:phage gp16-like protein
MSSPAESRRSLLAKVHIAKKQLGMSDDDYRQMLLDRFDVDSSAKLPFLKLNELVRHFEALGVTFTSSRNRASQRRANFYEVPDGVSYARQKRMIAAMWRGLGWKMSGLDVRARKQFGVEKFVWIKEQEHLQTLAKDLLTRCRAKGVDVEGMV